MPKIVDHDERRRMIAAAVTDIAATDGLGDVSFRTVAERAGVSVSLVQHYFGDKANLLQTTLQIQSENRGRLPLRPSSLHSATRRGRSLAPRAAASSFLPLDDVSRRSMLLIRASPPLRSPTTRCVAARCSPAGGG